MKAGGPVELVVLEGGRPEGAEARPLPQGALRLVPGGPVGDLQAAIEETVEAARKVRREIEDRIARALDDLLRARDLQPDSQR
jgi:hypothetical protein